MNTFLIIILFYFILNEKKLLVFLHFFLFEMILYFGLELALPKGGKCENSVHFVFKKKIMENFH